MTILKAIWSFLTARWFLSLLGAVLLATLVWFYGDLLAIGAQRPLAEDVPKLIAILVIALLWGASNLWYQLKARRNNEQLVQALAEPATRTDPADGEVQELARRFTGALEQLKKRRMGGRGSRRWLYELPWYVLIGPPGSGKTTALVQSGLKFPLGTAQELRGIGGTRYCDWFFTDEAVLVDTAGRYTTQESDQSVDSAAWGGFLDLLRKFRPRQPLNGVLVAIAVKDLLEGGGKAAEHARAIRARLDEIEKRLGLRLPVYLILTKADLVGGFSEFFESLGEAERAQVWGITLPHAGSEADATGRTTLAEGLNALVQRLDRRLPERLAAERDLERRARLFSFPAQMQALVPEILRLVDAIAAGSGWSEAPWVRGVYLTSGTQAGTPVDRLLAAIAQSVGLPKQPLASQAGDRSFFLTTLMRDVVFQEASLAGRDPRRERRESLLRVAAFTALALAAAGAIGGWAWSFVGNRDRGLAVEQSLLTWSRDAAPVAKDRLAPADAALPPILPALDKLASLRTAAAAGDPVSMRLGLSQAANVEAELDRAYRGGLVDMLLPRLMLRMEQQVQARIQDADFLLEALKVYLMLAGQAPADPELATTWFDLDLGSSEPQAAKALAPHLAALMPILPTLDIYPAPDRELIARAQETLGRIPLAQRVYRSLRQSPDITGFPGWTVTENAGPYASGTLVRRSGQPLGAPVPGIFTHAAFHGVYLPILDSAARDGFAENWVLGRALNAEPSPAELGRLKADLLRLYYDDAIAAWEGVLRDVTLQPLGQLDRAVEMTKALSGPNSPLKLLVRSIVAETSLTVPPPAEPAGGQPGAALAATATKALGKLSSKVGKLAKLVGKPGSAQAAAADAAPPGAPVEQHFAYLKDLVEGVNGAPPALDEAITALASLNAKLAEASLSASPAAAFARIGPTGAAQLAAAAQQLPAPMGPMLEGIAKSAQSMSSSGIREQINAAWRGEVLPFCRTALGGRFPFSRGSATDVSIEDAGRLFAPGGMIDGFVKSQLANFVDTTTRPWRDTQGVGFSGGGLAQLERARRIGFALFPAGAQPRVTFSLTTLELDTAAASMVLDLDGQELRYDHGPTTPKSFVWPGPGGTGVVRLSMVPVGGAPPVTVVKEGAWSLFRLFQEGGIRGAGQPDLFELGLRAGGYAARLRLKAGSVENPFDLGLLAGYGCPEGL